MTSPQISPVMQSHPTTCLVCVIYLFVLSLACLFRLQALQGRAQLLLHAFSCYHTAAPFMAEASECYFNYKNSKQSNPFSVMLVHLSATQCIC